MSEIKYLLYDLKIYSHYKLVFSLKCNQVFSVWRLHHDIDRIYVNIPWRGDPLLYQVVCKTQLVDKDSNNKHKQKCHCTQHERKGSHLQILSSMLFSLGIHSYLTSWPQILIVFLLSFLLLQCSFSSYSLCNRLVMSEKSSLSEINIEAPENVENLSQLFRFCHLKAKLNKENCCLIPT